MKAGSNICCVSIDSAASRADASSIASGIPSSRRQTRATASAFRSVRAKPGATVRALSRKSAPASLAGVNCFVNTGTVWQHYSGQDYDPVNLYAATKQAFEAVLAYYTRATSIRAITLKLSDTYGPEDERGKLVSALERASCTGETISMSPGEQLVDIVHVYDVVRAFRIAAERLLSNVVDAEETYFVTTGRTVSLKDWVTEYVRVAGFNLKIDWGVRPYRPRELMVPYSGATIPGWKAEYDLERGVREIRRRAASEGNRN